MWYFKPRLFGSKRKRSGDVVGVTKKCQSLSCTTVLFKTKCFLYFYICFLYVICVKIIINLLQCESAQLLTRVQLFATP